MEAISQTAMETAFFLDAFYAYKTLEKETCNTCLVEEGGSGSEGGRHDMQTKKNY